MKCKYIGDKIYLCDEVVEGKKNLLKMFKKEDKEDV